MRRQHPKKNKQTNKQTQRNRPKSPKTHTKTENLGWKFAGCKGAMLKKKEKTNFLLHYFVFSHSIFWVCESLKICRVRKRTKLFFHIVGIAPLHLWIFFIYFLRGGMLKAPCERKWKKIVAPGLFFWSHDTLQLCQADEESVQSSDSISVPALKSLRPCCKIPTTYLIVNNCWGPGLRRNFVLWQMALDLGPPRSPKKTEKCVCRMGKNSILHALKLVSVC